ncbi:MAG: histidine phosphatase family protein [Chloroflexi bacterium]|nr:histidine phosphatase family protein [Chloroflexota bacterium]
MIVNSTEIVLIRHGQTEWNRVERFRGRVDIPLNATGVAQAAAVASRIARQFRPAAIYSGPLSRTVRTAEPVAEATGLTVQILQGLIDIDCGGWHRLTPEEAEASYPEEYALWLSKPQLAHIPGGETLDAVRARAMAALEEVAEAHRGQTIVLVSHKVVCKVLLCAVLGLDNSHFWNIEQDNGAMSILEHLAGTHLVKLMNDTCHLDGIV